MVNWTSENTPMQPQRSTITDSVSIVQQKKEKRMKKEYQDVTVRHQ